MKTTNDICRNEKARAILDTVTMVSKCVDKTDAERKQWPRGEKFICTVKRNGKRASFAFFQGEGYNGSEPHKSTVLNCVALDSSAGINGESFELWACELGYDTDSIQALRIFKACKRNYIKAARLFTDSELMDLMNMENEED